MKTYCLIMSRPDQQSEIFFYGDTCWRVSGREDLLHDQTNPVKPGPVWELGVVVSTKWDVLWRPGGRVLPLCHQAGPDSLHPHRLDPCRPHTHRLTRFRGQLPAQSQHWPTDSVSCDHRPNFGCFYSTLNTVSHVLKPIDLVVFGGNFLHGLNIDLQIRWLATAIQV